MEIDIRKNFWTVVMIIYYNRVPRRIFQRIGHKIALRIVWEALKEWEKRSGVRLSGLSPKRGQCFISSKKLVTLKSCFIVFLSADFISDFWEKLVSFM